ncbi:MAG TPA: hypothetical protein VK009_17985 [Chloroflexota bacterium]|jgi:hypothetical protein|nr:hypothetical protein [Chloroflexota bacterium]
MDTLRHHRSPRWLNARMRLARLTIPQWLALALAAAAGAGLYLALAQVTLPRPLAGSAFYLRLLLVGPPSGLLGVLLYALADDRREPFIRQALFYLLRRHHYEEGAPRARTGSPRSHRFPGQGTVSRVTLARALARLRRRGHAPDRDSQEKA